MSGDASQLAVDVQGGLLPADLLARLAAGHDEAGLRSGDYHLAAGETVREAANRVWSYLKGVWEAYREALDRLPATDRATTLTRERWLLIMLDQLGYGRVATTGAGGLRAGDRTFPISHAWQSVPIHLLGARIDLDRRTQRVAGAASSSPQSLLQELLNSSDAHLWGLLSNGRVLRLLRDSTSLVGSAYVEFDLEAIFDGDLFADFLLLYTLCHQSRLEVRDADIGPASCWLEQWRQAAAERGTRALDQLRTGVVTALEALGSGFLGHPQNAALRERLDGRRVSLDDVHHALLRVVYRLLFTFVAEDRDALLDPAATPTVRDRFDRYFSSGRLRRIARRRRGSRHSDRWRALTLVWDGLGRPGGRPELGLAGIGGLFEAGEVDLFTDCELTNEALLEAVRALSLVREPRSGMLRVVDYQHLDAEELGSIYESLLEYVPSWDAAARRYRLTAASGNARKSTGSYYTPTSLIDSLLESALEPVLDERQKNAADPEAALLSVTVCDPACGSGHFLVAAARRIAKRVAEIRTGDPEPSPGAVRSALRDVVSRCVYGVDLNPLAAELAKVSLWLEALEPGRPLAFLDAQIKVGNALIGATPALLADGIPDVAFKPIEGDDRRFATELAKRNKRERQGQDTLFELDRLDDRGELAAQAEDLVGAPALSLTDIQVQQKRLVTLASSPDYRRSRRLADAWCAAFVWPKKAGAPPAVTNRVLHDLAEEPEAVPAETHREVARLAAEYRFFHWQLEFPHIFADREGEPPNPVTGWAGGFDVVLGNPPWERVKLQEQEFFASRDPDIALAPNAAARKRLIAALEGSQPALYDAYRAALRRADGESHLLRNTGRYPLAGRGDINTYAVFAEGDRNLLASAGRMGIIVPTGIATDATTQFFFKDLVETRTLVSLFDFENRRPLFVGVDSRSKFCLLTVSGLAAPEPVAEFAFFAHDPADLLRASVRFELTPEEIKLLNPNTGTCPVFRTRRDAEITLGIYRRVPVLINENDPVNGNPWSVKFMRMFDMSNDSHLFHTRDELEADGWTLHGNVFQRGKDEMLPLYEAKMIHHYDHRWATYERDGTVRDVTEEEKCDLTFRSLPRYWVAAAEVRRKLGSSWDRRWLLGWRDICRSTDERTMIAAILGEHASPEGGTLLALIRQPAQAPLLLSQWNSFVLDFVARQKIGGTHLKYFTVRQLPALTPSFFDLATPWSSRAHLCDWLTARVLLLTVDSKDMEVVAREFGKPKANEPWNAECRASLRAELDAAMMHLYGISRDDVDYIMETFPIVKRKDIAAHGEYRTKRMILEIYDAMAEAIRTGVPYE